VFTVGDHFIEQNFLKSPQQLNTKNLSDFRVIDTENILTLFGHYFGAAKSKASVVDKNETLKNFLEHEITSESNVYFVGQSIVIPSFLAGIEGLHSQVLSLNVDEVKEIKAEFIKPGEQNGEKIFLDLSEHKLAESLLTLDPNSIEPSQFDAIKGLNKTVTIKPIQPFEALLSKAVKADLGAEIIDSHSDTICKHLAEELCAAYGLSKVWINEGDSIILKLRRAQYMNAQFSKIAIDLLQERLLLEAKALNASCARKRMIHDFI